MTSSEIPSSGDPPTFDRDFEAFLSEYFQNKESGQPTDAEFFLERYAGCRAEVLGFLRTCDLFARAAASLSPSSAWVGEFEVLKELGRGVASRVFLARRRGTNDLRALKIVELGNLSSKGSRALRRVTASSEAARRMDHPNIVKLFDHGETEPGRYQIEMEYIDGEDLQQTLVRKAAAGTPFSVREAVELARVIAEAVDYSHRQGVIHRDMKPSNVMIERSGRVAITDFGLARAIALESDATVTGEILGTPCYMSPEQASADHAKVGSASDMYAVGAILYELLTGLPPFAPQRWDVVVYRVLHESPTPPRAIRLDLPKELEVICLRCLEKKPQDRGYANARELAEDLGRWLAGKPVRVRPPGRVERLKRWCRSHPVKSTIAAAMSLLLVAGGIASSLYTSGRQEQRLKEREIALTGARHLTLGDHWQGWRGRALDRLSSLGWKENDSEIENQVVAALLGIDARALFPVEQPDPLGPTESVAFWGDRLLLSAYPQVKGNPTRIWDPATRQMRKTAIHREGPVGVRKDGVPVQLSSGSPDHFQLWNLDREEILFELDPGVSPSHGDKELPETSGPLLSMDTDASTGAMVVARDGSGRTAILWDLMSGRRVASSPVSSAAVSLAVSPGGVWLAVGTRGGQVEIRSLKHGELRVLEGDPLPVQALAFGRNPRQSLELGEPKSPSFLLAAGHFGGTVKVWDPRTASLISVCRGSKHWINSIDFSPDGMTLASAGKYEVRLWDIATGKSILILPAGTDVGAVAFSSDGMGLVATSLPPDTGPGWVMRWTMEHDSAIRTLRGLASPVARTRLSADKRILTALASDWTVGVWDLEHGRLVHVLEAPAGSAVDNASLCIDALGNRIALASGEHLTLWDLEGECTARTWRLDPGLTDQVALHPTGAILLLRGEKETLYLRDFSVDPPRELKKLTKFFDSPRRAAVADDGSVFLAQGIEEGAGGPRRVIKAFDGPTGKDLWSLPLSRNGRIGTIDPSGGVAEIVVSDMAGEEDAAYCLVDLKTGATLQTSKRRWGHLSPGALLHVSDARLYRRGEQTPIFDLGNEIELSLPRVDPQDAPYAGFRRRLYTYQIEFSLDGRLVAYGTEDGRVMVCDIAEVELRLRRHAFHQ